jgi:small subunit ribosomal protein S2
MAEMENTNQLATAEPEAVLPYSPAALEEVVKAGVCYGRKKSLTNPKMRQFVLMNRNGVEILDPVSVLDSLDGAKKFLREIAKTGGLILFVGTRPSAKEGVARLANQFDYPYVTRRWLGGTLTNFATMSKRLNHYMNLKADRSMGKLEKYTKRERLEIDREIAKMEELFGGLERMKELPRALLVVDAKAQDIAIREAMKTRIPVLALANTDADPEAVQQLIPANTSSKTSIAWVLAQLEEAIAEGRKEAQTSVTANSK